MCYITKPRQRQRKAEAQLPLWKQLFFLLLWPGTSLAAGLEQQIQQAIHQEVRQFSLKLGGPARPKTRISLNLPAALQDKAACSGLQISRGNPQQAPWGRVSYSLNCPAPQSWQSRATAQVQVWLPIVVSSRALQRDEVLTAQMLKLELTELRQSRLDPELQIEPLLGMRTKRRLSAGQPVSRHLLEAQLLVRKGQHVIIQVKTADFAASTTGVALEDGVLHQRIRVQNSSSGAELEAEVVAEDTVQTLFRKD
ncbi:flagellar basal body P-ring formation chaperone FlgA [Rheinheimera sp.]|uniref:flagellar basal body P-ring formation chaperone FlgA n=1 Tax=Rheinheimera sp. TaxID=1869214 RepID=UPI00307E972E